MINPLRTLWDRGEPGMNAWLNIGHTFSAEIMAAQDFDALTIDCQHGPSDFSALLPMFPARSVATSTDYHHQ